MRHSLLLIALTVGGVIAGIGSAPAADRDCSVYSEPRIFLEAQSWWQQTPGAPGTDFGHVHVGTCFSYQRAYEHWASARAPFHGARPDVVGEPGVQRLGRAPRRRDVLQCLVATDARPARQGAARD